MSDENETNLIELLPSDLSAIRKAVETGNSVDLSQDIISYLADAGIVTPDGQPTAFGENLVADR